MYPMPRVHVLIPLAVSVILGSLVADGRAQPKREGLGYWNARSASSELPPSWNVKQIEKEVPNNGAGRFYVLAWYASEWTYMGKKYRADKCLVMRVLDKSESGRWRLYGLYRGDSDGDFRWRLSMHHAIGGEAGPTGMWYFHYKHFKTRPTNKDIYDALSWTVLWEFRGDENCVGCGVCEKNWETAIGEKPTRFFPKAPDKAKALENVKQKSKGKSETTPKGSKVDPERIKDMVQKVLKTKNLGEAEDHYEALFLYSGRAGLPMLRECPHDGVAIQAAWQDVALGTTGKSGNLNREKVLWFLGFLEGRLRIRPPDWWRDALLASEFNDQGSVFVWKVNKHRRYEQAGVGEVMSPPGTKLKRKNKDLVVQIGGQTATVSEDVVLKKKRGDRVSAAITVGRCYLAVHDDLGFAYPLVCVDRVSGKRVWKAEVWDVFWLRGGLSWLSNPSINDRAVAVIEQDERVVVFGAGITGFNIEGFRASDGSNLFRFSSSCGLDFGAGKRR
jgi:hypothetical protein